MAHTVGAGWAPFTLVREKFLASSRTLDFASTMEGVPAVVDLKRTKGIFLDAERCIILGGEEKKKKRKKKGGEWSPYRERKGERCERVRKQKNVDQVENT